MNQIKIPQGMRDLIFDETEKKRILQKKIETIFEKSGYREVCTPAVEFFTTYANAFNDVKSEEMYRFFDQEGRMLVLREDMTVPIARVCASKFANAQPPFRIRYTSDVFKVRHAFAGRRNEVTDCGIELIGMDESADLEVLVTALDVMETFGVNDYVLEIGNPRFFRKAAEETGLNKEQISILADLIDRKSLVELQAFLDGLNLTAQQKEFFNQLPLLGGGREVLEEASELSFSSELKEEVQKLSKLYGDLKDLGYDRHVSFDFGKAPHLDYYTGIIFEGYVDRVGTSVLSGGRYDNLLGKFGRDLPAIGFSVKLDYLLDILPDEKHSVIRIYYPKGMEKQAILKAKELRENKTVELIESDGDAMEVKE